MSKHEQQLLSDMKKLSVTNHFRLHNGLAEIIQKERECLKCSGRFESKSQANRMCYKCASEKD